VEKLKSASRRLQIVVITFIILTPCAVALSVGTGSWSELLHIPQDIHFDASQISGLSLFAVILLGSLKPVVYMLAFWFLYQLLDLYRVGIIFAAGNVAAIRKIGWAIASIDIAGMIQTVVSGPILTFFDISSAYVSVQLEVGFLTIGFFVVLIAYVMDMGRELKEQDSLVI